jgi:hypothetical protein
MCFALPAGIIPDTGAFAKTIKKLPNKSHSFYLSGMEQNRIIMVDTAATTAP